MLTSVVQWITCRCRSGSPVLQLLTEISVKYLLWSQLSQNWIPSHTGPCSPLVAPNSACQPWDTWLYYKQRTHCVYDCALSCVWLVWEQKRIPPPFTPFRTPAFSSAHEHAVFLFLWLNLSTVYIYIYIYVYICWHKHLLCSPAEDNSA